MLTMPIGATGSSSSAIKLIKGSRSAEKTPVSNQPWAKSTFELCELFQAGRDLPIAPQIEP